jgi:ABC-type nitrate/sulfonate/bicarbonate transport system permease component
VTRARNVALGLIMPAVLFTAWWFTSADSTSAYFPALERSVNEFAHVWFWERFESDLLPSITRFAIGFTVAGIVGVGGGTLLGLSPRLRRDVSPITEFCRAMPVAALVPVGLIIFGPGTQMEASLIAFAAMFPILLSTTDGIRGVDPVQLAMAEVYGLSRGQRVSKVMLPAAMPQILAGFRIALAIALAAMVIANMFGSGEGVGYFIVNAQSAFDVPSMWAGLFMIGLLGCIVNLLFVFIQSRVLAWHRGWRGAAMEAK